MRWYELDLSGGTAGSLATGLDARTIAASLEVGRRIAFSPQWSLTPQAQIVWSRTEFDAFVDPDGFAVSLVDGNSLVGRLGLALERNRVWQDSGGGQALRGYALANLRHEFMADRAVLLEGFVLSRQAAATTGELAFGFARDWNDGLFSVFGELGFATSLTDFGADSAMRGYLGMRWRF
jgi:outer membrane autotransporter protein